MWEKVGGTDLDGLSDEERAIVEEAARIDKNFAAEVGAVTDYVITDPIVFYGMPTSLKEGERVKFDVKGTVRKAVYGAVNDWQLGVLAAIVDANGARIPPTDAQRDMAHVKSVWQGYGETLRLQDPGQTTVSMELGKMPKNGVKVVAQVFGNYDSGPSLTWALWDAASAKT